VVTIAQLAAPVTTHVSHNSSTMMIFPTQVSLRFFILQALEVTIAQATARLTTHLNTSNTALPTHILGSLFMVVCLYVFFIGPEGYYCPAYSSTYYACPAGRYCPAYSSAANYCPGGQYQPNAYYTYCFGCPAGYYCPSGATTYYACKYNDGIV
jgi:hypothetical protein